MLKTLLLTVCAGALAHAQVPNTVRVSSETAPPGGMVQVKVLLTSPQPITGGGVSFAGALSTADGISLFSSTGDVFGVAVQNGQNVFVRYVSPRGTFGTEVDYPVMTVTFGVGTNVAQGDRMPVTLGSSTFWQDLTGSPVAVEVKPGTISIGGSVSITDVVPGGGALPAGGTFSIRGMGFSPETRVSLRGLLPSDITCVSPTEIRVTLLEAGVLDGERIRVKNPDGSGDTYFSYLRGVSAAASTNPLIASAVPVFSTRTATAATLGPLILPQFNSPYVAGLALQNPGAETANIRLELRSAAGSLLNSVALALDPRMKISRDLAEWFGSAIPSGATVRVVSDQPVQTLGLLGNTSDGSVLPIGLAAR